MPTRLSGYRRTSPHVDNVDTQAEDSKAGITADIYLAAKGRKFGSWITADGRSIGYATTDLIENPALIIESLFRDEVELVSAQINIASFNDLANTTDGRRKDWKFARSILEQAGCLDVVHNIAEEAGLVSIHDYANLVRVVALDHYNPSLQLNNAHIVEIAGRPQVRVRQSHVKYICNEFFLNYKFNNGSGNFDKQFFITATDHNLVGNARNDKSPLNTYTGLCTQSQSMYNVVQRWTFDADWIRDDATAELFIKLMADWLALRKWEIEADLWYSADTMKLEVMDQVLWDLDLLPMSVRNNLVLDVTATPGTSGGALADGTYYYVVTAVDPYGENKKSAEVSATISGGGGNGKVRITWSALSGATKYRIYGRVSAAQDIYYECDAIYNYFDDLGGTPYNGSPPAVASAFFITRIIDPGLTGGGKFTVHFLLCPTIFFLAEMGYGYRYGEDYGVQL